MDAILEALASYGTAGLSAADILIATAKGWTVTS